MKNLSLVFRSLALPVLLLTLNAAGAQEKQPLRYVDAATLTVIGKSMPTPKLFQRVDTARYELWQPVKNYSAFSTGLAVVFRTDSRTIRARWKTGGYGLGHNMTAIARKGLDLYIERDGQWVYAGFGWPKGDNHDSALVEYMDEGEKTCLVYLPLWDEVLSLDAKRRALIAEGDSLRAARNSLSKQVGVLMKEGKKDKALAALEYAEKMIPAFNVPYDVQNGALEMAEAYYQLGNNTKADQIIDELANKSVEYLTWYLSLDDNHLLMSQREFIMHLSALDMEVKMMEKYKSKLAGNYTPKVNELYNIYVGRMKAHQ